MASMPQRTSWRLVLQAKGDDSAEAQSAMEDLARSYWPPVYGYMRRKVGDPEKALDLTQEFFSTFMEKRWIDAADPAKGKFRTFILVILDRFLADQHDREKAVKRGGNLRRVPLDVETAERFVGACSGGDKDPALVFIQQWALAVIRECLAKLRSDLESRGQDNQYRVFAKLHGFDQIGPEPSYSVVAKELSITEADVTNYLHRTRAAFRRILEDRILHSVESPAEVQAEITTLFQAIS